MKKFVRRAFAFPLSFIFFTGRRFCLSILILSITSSSWSQVLFSENFDRANSTTVGNGWTELENGVNGAQIVSNRLQLGSVALSGREFVLRDAAGLYVTNGLTNNTGQLEWAFNFRTTRTDPSGFSSGGYGIGFILAKSTADITGGVGYAVILGSSNSPDPVRLVRFSNGIDANTDFTDIISSGAYTGNEYLSIRVVYNAITDEWSLFAESNANSFPQTNPANTITQVGSTTVNTTYTTNNDLRYLGAYWNHGTVSTQNAIFDDISVSLLPVTYYPRTSATDLSQPSQWTTDPTGTAGTAPTNFTSANQIFNLNSNVTSPSINNAWALTGGSNLVLNNTASVIINPTAGLTVGTGSKADFNGKSVTLKSSATATAFIGNTTGIITNATNVTVERYISSLNNRAYRLLAPSVSTTTSIYTNWQEGGSTAAGYGTHITGSTTGANGFDATQTGNPSLYLYNATVPAWEAISNTNTTLLSALTGYLTLVRGDRTVDLNSTASPLPTTNTVLRATGILLTGNAGFTYPSATSFQLITNPYPSSINWANVKAQSTGIEPYYTFWDPNIGSRGGYVTVNANGNVSPVTSTGSVIIPSGVAFFVKGNGGSPFNVEIKEAHKTTASSSDIFRIGSQTETFGASLFYTNTLGQRVAADGVLAVYNNDYSVDYDEGDAAQIANWDEDVAISRNGRSLSIESRPLIDATDTIYLSVARLKAQNYEWQFDAANFNQPGLQAVLVDNFLSTRTPLSLTNQTIVPFSVTTTASSASNRFMVVFQDPTVLPVQLAQITAQQKGKDVLLEWTSFADTEVKNYSVEKSSDGRTFGTQHTLASRMVTGTAAYTWLDVQPGVGKNYYRIKLTDRLGVISYSSIVSLDLRGAATPIVVYPNPLTGNEIGLSTNLPVGLYTLRLVNLAGQTIYAQKMTHSGGAMSQTIVLPHNIPAGAYEVVIASPQSSYTQHIIKN